MQKLLATVAALGFAAPAFAQEESQMSMEEVPQTVMEAAQSEAETRNVTLESVQMDSDQGTETYELSGTMENGMMFEIDVLEDGTVEEIEEEVEMSAVPEEVSAALEENLPGFQPDFIEKSTRPADDGRVVYEFEGSHDGNDVDVEINEDGTNYMMNEDTAG
ncbi:PepSY domain-containing protein [Paracoccus liaowanqingii]|nr:PepSY domain-containing protein [Paracoccus liaowanqingii]